MGVGDVTKRIRAGREPVGARRGETLLPKRIAFGVRGGDALSSVAFAPDQILLVLALAGASAYAFTWEVGLAVAAAMVVLVLSYRRVLQLHPCGEGDYEVARSHLGPRAGLLAGGALAMDLVLTVAVAVSAAAQYAVSAIEVLQGHQVWLAAGAVLVLVAIHLRGTRAPGLGLALPTYLFLGAMLALVVTGFARETAGDLPDAPTAGLTIVGEEGFTEGVGGMALAFLLVRAFGVGAVSLAGAQALVNGGPDYQRPRSRNAATMLATVGGVTAVLGLSVIVLANLTGVRMAADPQQLLDAQGDPVGPGFHQEPLVGQLARTVFDGFTAGYVLVAVLTTAMLVLVANAAFRRSPDLGLTLARDGYAPWVLAARGDRLVAGHGTIALAAASILLVVVLGADVMRLVPLYIVGVFFAFTISQVAMVRHWIQNMPGKRDKERRREVQINLAINAAGTIITTTVLLVVLVMRFVQGAWLVVLAIAGLVVLMQALHRHYGAVAAEMAASDQPDPAPTRVHTIVVIEEWHDAAARALAYAQASRPDALEVVTVATDDDRTAELMDQWETRSIQTPLKVLPPAGRDASAPLAAYAAAVHRSDPDTVVSIHVLEDIGRHWWQRLRRGRTTLRLERRLLLIPGVMVTSVPVRVRAPEVH